jgi:8-oxo-dGTP pyrophosphatase MutT (NUDIX family)
MDLLTQLEQYVPWNEQEAEDREELLLGRLRSGEDLYTRENRSAHLTASAWVVSPDRRQVLMAYHNLYNSWAWLGGHADGERDLLSAALREVREESGLRHVRPISDQIPGNFNRGRPRKAGPVRSKSPAPEHHLPVGSQSGGSGTV